MRIAIFSDVHGNLTALEAVLEHLASQPDVDKIVCAGDICLFGPRPLECLDLIHQSDIENLVGNTDEWLRNPPPIHDNMDEGLRKNRQNIQEWCSWTLDQFSEPDHIRLDEVRSVTMRRYSPTENPDEDLLVVHANPIDLMEVIYPSIDSQVNIFGEVRQSDEDLEPLLKGVRAAALAFGHLHIPSIRNWGDLLLANISSVSLPGDSDKRAKYAILSWSPTNRWTAEHFFVDYDVASEIVAYDRHKPPGWEIRVETLSRAGIYPQ
ncbi:MAG: metallophosphoesterase family protein [Anaerolineae bacterium]|nr:MAG: metallophosphoesterase family protein [Anaerolineae bacterium]